MIDKMKCNVNLQCFSYTTVTAHTHALALLSWRGNLLYIYYKLNLNTDSYSMVTDCHMFRS